MLVRQENLYNRCTVLNMFEEVQTYEKYKKKITQTSLNQHLKNDTSRKIALNPQICLTYQTCVLHLLVFSCTKLCVSHIPFPFSLLLPNFACSDVEFPELHSGTATGIWPTVPQGRGHPGIPCLPSNNKCVLQCFIAAEKQY